MDHPMTARKTPVLRLLALALSAAPAAAAQDIALSDPARDAGAAAAAPAEVVMLRLRDGSIQWGGIVEHSPDDVTFRRIDTGGVVRLGWSFLDPRQEGELRLRFGYVDVEGEEVMMTAQLLVLVDGSEVVGEIVGHTDSEIIVKDHGGTHYVAKRLVRDTRDGLRVSALDLYTKEELYTRELVKIDAEDPAAHVELAGFCERILAFGRAREHYELARELDSDFMAAELPVILERVAIKAQQEEQLDFLAEVERLKRRKKYGEALTQLEAFDGLFPGSPLRVDRLKLADRVVKARDQHVRDEVRRRWYSSIDRFAGMAARDKGFEEVIAYVDEGMSEEIAERVSEHARTVWPEIDVDQVRQMWLERKPGRWKPASYGLGTWLLGEEAALKGGPETQQEEPKSEQDQRRADLEEKIARFLRNQEMAKSARKSQEDQEDVEEFWATLSYAARKSWIVAYYAENSGDVQVRPQPELQNCPECGGTGTREIVYSGSARTGGGQSGLRLVACETCKGIGRLRKIRYR